MGIYHSHPRSPAEPSQTDINLAHYPHWTYLIVSLERPEEPVVRAWRIADGRAVAELPESVIQSPPCQHAWVVRYTRAE